MKNITQIMKECKSLESFAHISLDDILNKVTQEVSELIETYEAKDTQEMYKEAGDVLINILSAAQELGVELDFGKQQKSSGNTIIQLLGDWNSKVQALRGRYTRDDVSVEEVSEITQEFVSTVLTYTDPERNLSETIQINLEKMNNRINMYKPDINIKDYIANYPDFPKPGIQFKDISPILADPEALKYTCMEMAEACKGADKIVALDARGFIFAPMIAEILNIPWVMARKPGKLPGRVEQISYELEYGSNTIEIQKEAILPGENIAIVDDLLATGGTALAAASLVEKLGGKVMHCAFVIGLDEEFLLGLPNRKELGKYSCSQVVNYN